MMFTQLTVTRNCLIKFNCCLINSCCHFAQPKFSWLCLDYSLYRILAVRSIVIFRTSKRILAVRLAERTEFCVQNLGCVKNCHFPK